MSTQQQQQQQEQKIDAQGILDKITSTECAICMSNLTHTNFTSTECGHWFHSSCIFQNMMQRVECPLCRKELAEIPEDSDDDDEDEEDSDSEDDDSEDEDEDLEDATTTTTTGSTSTTRFQPIDTSITCKQATQKMLELGYNVEDLMYLLVGRLDQRERTKYKRSFRHQMEHDLQHILEGDVPVDYRDARTYAQVASGEQRREEAGIGPTCHRSHLS